LLLQRWPLSERQEEQHYDVDKRDYHQQTESRMESGLLKNHPIWKYTNDYATEKDDAKD
jgi:hypothetical protein